MKKILIALGIVLALLLGAALALPLIFKDDIKAAIDKAIAEKVNAKVYYSADQFSLSLFSHFPHLTVQMGDFGVVGQDRFQGDTLASVKQFSLVVNLFSLFGDKISINRVELASPRIRALRLADGAANWDIMKPDTAAPAQPSPATQEAATFAIAIERWKISDGNIFLADEVTQTYASIQGLNHEGRGDITQDIFDIETKTTTERVRFESDSTTYLNNQQVSIDLNLNLNLPESKYTFRDNVFRINDFGLHLDGFAQMKGDAIAMDLTWKTTETTFKNLFSLVPGVYTEAFADIKTDGEVAFDGFAKGTFTGTSYPSFGLNLLVKEGMVQYPKLPTAITNINVDLNVSNATASLENTVLNLKKFHMDLDKNPVDARLLVKGLTRSEVDADIKAKLNLADLSSAFPVKDLTLKGLFGLDVKAQGVYEQASGSMPSIRAAMTLLDGYVKAAQFPIPLEKVNCSVKVDNATGKIPDTKVHVENYTMVMDGEPFQVTAFLENFADLAYDVKAKGTVDLAKMTAIYPVEGYKLAGKLTADLVTKGRMSDVDAKRYDKLPTSGTMGLANFEVSGATLAQPVKISEASLSLSPKALNLTRFEGMLGKSDVRLTGSLSNYLGWMLRSETLVGNLTLNSTRFDANEWLPKSEPAPAKAPEATPAPANPATGTATAVTVPKNLDFTFRTSIDEMLYTNLNLKQVKGGLTVRDGKVLLSNLGCQTLGGSVVSSGSYDPNDPVRPLFDFDLKIKEVAIKQAVDAFETLAKMVPAAKNMMGNFSTDFAIRGALQGDMTPVYPTLNGGGTVLLSQAKLSNFSLVSGLNKTAKLNLPSEVEIKDTRIKAEVKDGRIFFSPFDIVAGTTKVNLSGSQGLDQTIDYLAKVNMPASAAGAAGAAVAAFLGGGKGGNINVNIKITGTNKNPQYSLAGIGTGEGGGDNGSNSLKQAAEDKAKAEVDRLKKEAEDKAKAETDRLKKEAEDKAKAEEERLKKEAQDRLNAEKEKLRKKLGF